MQKRISRVIAITVTIAVVIFGLAAFAVSFTIYTGEAEDTLKAIALMYSDDYEHTAEEIHQRLSGALDYEIRVTEIASDGTVLYDSSATITENHLNRKEVKEAFETGIGQDTRSSSTLGEITFYCAVRHGDEVLRFARQRTSILSVALGLISIMFLVGGIIVIVSVATSVVISQKLTKPFADIVKQLDILNNPENKITVDAEYEELQPLIDTIEGLRHKLRRYIQKLKDAEQIRAEFSANVSHELKTPLTTIKGFGEMLENGLITDREDVKKYGGTIYRESTRLLSLINDIIRLSEIEENDVTVNPEVDLLEIANAAADSLADKAENSNVSVTVQGEHTFAHANQMYIGELFTNLIDNAIKYNKQGGSVRVSVTKSDGNAVISVKDTGIGIPDDSKDRIFERFYRVDKSHSRAIGGTGLGLSIVKHIVNYHKGRIELESELGVGTEITVFLPV
ncbi:MAG: sensor histidine kinase [Ruminiclostridium sp.]